MTSIYSIQQSQCKHIIVAITKYFIKHASHIEQFHINCQTYELIISLSCEFCKAGV